MKRWLVCFFKWNSHLWTSDSNFWAFHTCSQRRQGPYVRQGGDSSQEEIPPGDAGLKTSEVAAFLMARVLNLRVTSAPTFTVLWSWAGYLSFQNLFLPSKIQIVAPMVKHCLESSCGYHILLGISMKHISGCERDHSQGNDSFS